jgi:hypothetical protein
VEPLGESGTETGLSAEEVLARVRAGEHSRTQSAKNRQWAGVVFGAAFGAVAAVVGTSLSGTINGDQVVMNARWDPISLFWTSVSVLSAILLLAWLGRVTRAFGRRLRQRISAARRVQVWNYCLVFIFSAMFSRTFELARGDSWYLDRTYTGRREVRFVITTALVFLVLVAIYRLYRFRVRSNGRWSSLWNQGWQRAVPAQLAEKQLDDAASAILGDPGADSVVDLRRRVMAIQADVEAINRNLTRLLSSTSASRVLPRPRNVWAPPVTMSPTKTRNQQ